jgi:hypothetical protein
MPGAAEDLAIASGWVVVSETAPGGFLSRIGEAMRRIEFAPNGRQEIVSFDATGSTSASLPRPPVV